MNAMAMKTAQALAVLIGCGGVACGVGSAFHWTLPQAFTMAASLALVACWALRLRAGDGSGLLARPAVGVAAILALLVLAWAAFVLNPTGGLPWMPPIGHPLHVRMPRFLSMIVALLPAAPYAAYVLVALIPHREA